MKTTANTATPERILVSTNEQDYRRNKANFEPALPLVQRAYDTFAALNTGSPDLTAILDIAIFGKLESIVREYIYEHTPAVKSLPLKKEALMDMVELPKTFKAAQQAFQAIKDQREIFGGHFINPFQSRFFSLSNGKVSLNWDTIEQELDMYRTYVEDPAEVELFKELKDLAERMQAVHEKGRGRVFAQRSGYGVIGLDGSGKVFFDPARVKGILTSKYY